MPRRHQPFSLKRATMVVIAQNFDLICYACSSQEKMRRMLESDEYLNVDSPLKDLPSHLTEELAEEMKHITYLRRHHLHALLTPLTQKWSSDGVCDLQVAINLLPHRCKNLQRLDISYLRHINPNTLLSLVPTFKLLVSLNLRMTLAIDQMLAKIGEQCPNLLELNLSATPITDRGMVMLCLGPDGSPRCQRLTRLIVNDTWVTSSGAAIVLLALPILREFDFDKMFEVMHIVDGWDGNMGERVLATLGVSSSRRPLDPRKTLCLTTVTSTSENPNPEAPAAAARLCPSATSLTVNSTPIPSESLYPFMVLRHLSSISLTNSRSNCGKPTMSFGEGVLPLLTAIGHQLKNLILSKFNYIDVAAIGKACPHLVNFALSEVTEFELMHQKPCEEYFQELEALELWADPDFILQANVLQQLLSFSPNMKNILFKGVGILTDSMLLNIWEVNPMKHLSHLTFDHCHSITNTILHHALDSDNELTVIRIWSCFRITKEAMNHISQRILNENMDIYFEWFQLEE